MDPATRDRVRRIARELGYRPSFVGRALVSGRAFTVGLLQPTRATLLYPFYQLIAVGLSEAMEAADYLPLVLFRSPAGRHLRVIRQGRVDGMLVLQSERDSLPIREVAATGVPTVAVNVHYAPGAGEVAGCVHSDHRRMMQDAIAELVGLGCRSLLAIHDYRSHDANATLHDAFVHETARLAGQGVVGSALIPAAEGPREQFRSLFRCGQRWDGFFVDGARVAEVLVAEGMAAGVIPGRDYRLVTTETEPGRRTSGAWEHAMYCHQAEEVGRAAWRLLADLIDGKTPCREVQIPYRREAVSSKAGAAEAPPPERT